MSNGKFMNINLNKRSCKTVKYFNNEIKYLKIRNDFNSFLVDIR